MTDNQRGGDARIMIREGAVKKNTNAPPTGERPPPPRSQLMPVRITDTPRDDDAERLAQLRAMIGRKGKPTVTAFVCDIDALFLALDSRDAALREKDAKIKNIVEKWKQCLIDVNTRWDEVHTEARADIERLNAASAAKEREGRCAAWREFGDTLKKRIWDNKKPDFSMKDAVEAINTHHQFEYDRALAARAPESKP